MDQAGSAYVTGTVSSGDFPATTGALHNASTGVFVAKLNPAGDSLAYAAIVAPTGTAPAGIAVDTQGSAYITGSTMGQLPARPTRWRIWNLEASARIPS